MEPSGTLRASKLQAGAGAGAWYPARAPHLRCVLNAIASGETRECRRTCMTTASTVGPTVVFMAVTGPGLPICGDSFIGPLFLQSAFAASDKCIPHANHNQCWSSDFPKL